MIVFWHFISILSLQHFLQCIAGIKKCCGKPCVLTFFDLHLVRLVSYSDANAEGDENKPETVTPHEDWEIMSPPLDRQTSDVGNLLKNKKKSRIRVGTGEFNAI
jgi:hypothetical protein